MRRVLVVLVVLVVVMPADGTAGYNHVAVRVRVVGSGGCGTGRRGGEKGERITEIRPPAGVGTAALRTAMAKGEERKKKGQKRQKKREERKLIKQYIHI